MKEIKAFELKDNLFKIIGKDWMLVTAGTKEKFNTMTASWGGAGWLWNRPVAFVFIRPERYTYEFMESGDTFTLSFLEDPYREAYKICGNHSGREMDKVKAAGLTTELSPEGDVLFKEARMTLKCRKLYADKLEASGMLDPELPKRWYGEKEGAYHKMYVAEIMHIWVKG